MADANHAARSHPPSPAHAVLTPAEARLIVFGVLLAMLIAALDQTIVSTALPTIGNELGDNQLLTWVVSAYLLAATVVTPIYGKLSDLYGRRVTLLVAIGVFITGSAACALSPNMLTLIVARTFQGLGGGGLISLSQTIIGDIIPPKQRPRYQAYLSGTFVFASVAGPLLGGYIAEHLHWSIIFWINPPIGVAALALTYSLLRKLPVDRRHHQIDYVGALLLVIATIALMLALSWGGVRYPWGSTHILALLAVFAIFAMLFFMRQRRATEPLLPIDVLSNEVVLTATIACALCMGTAIGLVIFTPIYFETVRMLTPSQSGIALIPLMVGTAIGAGIAGRLMASLAHYKILPTIGLVIAIAAMTAMSFDPRGLPLPMIEVLLALTSIGFGTILPVTTICVQNAAPAGQLGVATAVLVFVRQLGGALVVAIFGAILFSQLHATGQIQGMAGADFTHSNADFTLIFRWIFGAAALGFLGSLIAILAMAELPLKEEVAGEQAMIG
jgi:EmrB/QacA subfamily drug resistance transporter